MSELPEVASNYFVERAGVIAVAAQLNAARLVWRETPNADVGIDGQIEFVSEDGKATGRLVAAQVKSGSSYVRWSGDAIVYTPTPKHANYWVRFPVPVLLFVHDPRSDRTYWTDARQQLRAPRRAPRDSHISPEHALQ